MKKVGLNFSKINLPASLAFVQEPGSLNGDFCSPVCSRLPSAIGGMLYHSFLLLPHGGKGIKLPEILIKKKDLKQMQYIYQNPNLQIREVLSHLFVRPIKTKLPYYFPEYNTKIISLDDNSVFAHYFSLAFLSCKLSL